MNKKKTVMEITAVYILLLVMTAAPLLLGRLLGNGYIAEILTFGTMFIVVYSICKKHRITAEDLGYEKEKPGRQLAACLIPLLITLSVFVFLPLLLGADAQSYLGGGSSEPVVIAGELFLYLVFVGPVEEFIFRGYMEERLGRLTDKGLTVSILSSLLFGFWHFPMSLNLAKVIITSLMGLVWSLSRRKIKSCSMQSISAAHGLHDSIIFLLACVLNV